MELEFRPNSILGFLEFLEANIYCGAISTGIMLYCTQLLYFSSMLKPCNLAFLHYFCAKSICY